MCTSGRPNSCQHTADQVMDSTIPIVQTINDKLTALCREEQETEADCDGTMDQKVLNELTVAESKAIVVAGRESQKAEKVYEVLKTAFGSIEASFRYRAGENFKRAAKANEFQDDVKKALEYIKEKGVVLYPNIVDAVNGAIEASVKEGSPEKLVDKIGAEQNKAKRVLAKTRRKTRSIKKKFSQAKKKVAKNMGKHARSPKSRAKLMNGLGSMVTGISFFASPYDENGKVDPLKIGKGVMSIVEGLGSMLPAPVNAITGLVSSIFNLFTGGGGPSTEEVIKEEFKKQKVGAKGIF